MSIADKGINPSGIIVKGGITGPIFDLVEVERIARVAYEQGASYEAGGKYSPDFDRSPICSQLRALKPLDIEEN